MYEIRVNEGLESAWEEHRVLFISLELFYWRLFNPISLYIWHDITDLLSACSLVRLQSSFKCNNQTQVIIIITVIYYEIKATFYLYSRPFDSSALCGLTR